VSRSTRCLFQAFHVTSRDTLPLTAHVAHTAVLNILISLDCRSNPSWAHSKICAQKTVYSRSSSLFSSVHCAHSARGTSHCKRSLYSGPSSLLNWKSREYAGSGIRQPPLIMTRPFNLHQQKSIVLSVTSQMGQKQKCPLADINLVRTRCNRSSSVSRSLANRHPTLDAARGANDQVCLQNNAPAPRACLAGDAFKKKLGTEAAQSFGGLAHDSEKR
jgi:hypothetical protein